MISNPPFENFDGFVTDLMRDLHVPGAAVAVVEKDRVVVSGGYGVRKLGCAEPVDQHTMFAMGSVTKALTTTMIARLVDEGKVSWDARVCDYVNDFQFFDPSTTKSCTLRDLALHRTGLQSTSPLIRYELPFSGRDAIARLRFMKPTYPFKSRYCYNDVAFAALSLCAEAATGIEWTELMKQYLFEPLGMNSTHLSTDRLKSSENLASAHGLVNGQASPVVYREKENTLAAASVNSNLEDITQYLLLHVNGGTLKGRQLLSETSLCELHSPQQLIRGRKRDGLLSTISNVFQSSQSIGEVWSGLGWDIEDFHNHRMIRRSGAVPGMIAQLVLIPDVEIGIAILSNSDVSGKEFLYALGIRIAEACLDVPAGSKPKVEKHEKSKPEAISNKSLELSNSSLEISNKSLEISNRSLEIAVDQYVGTFSDRVVGDVEVSIDDRKTLTLAYGNLIGDLEFSGTHECQVTWRDPYMHQHRMKVVFSEKENQAFNRLEIRGAGIFERAPKDS